MSKSEVTFRLPLSQPTQRPDIGLARIRTPGHLTLQTFGHQKLSHSDSNYSTRSSVFGEIELVVFKRPDYCKMAAGPQSPNVY